MSNEGSKSTGPVRGLFGGWERIQTENGKTSVRLDVGKQLEVIVESEGSEVQHANLPYPACGFGGHEFVLSPTERYLALFLYSGQSEVGYEVFELQPTLRHVGGLAYVYGMGDVPAFSADERFIALASATNSHLSLEECPVDDEGLVAHDSEVEWAELRVQELPTGPVQTCTFQLRVPRGHRWVEGNESYDPQHLAVDSRGVVSFRTAWGEQVTVAIPLPRNVILSGPFIPPD